MTLLLLLVGALVVCLGFETARAHGDGWTAWWAVCSVAWVVVGLGVLVAKVVRLAMTRAGIGLMGRAPQRPAPPAGKGEE